MKLNKSQTEALARFAPSLESMSTRLRVWVYFLLVIMAFAGYALYIQESQGHIATGMRDHVVWGLYIANFIFFIGISYAGAVISGILHLLHVEWRKPIIRIAELITVIATLIGPVFILLCMGRLDRLHHLVMYPRLQSPIIWDVLAISTYLFGSILFLYLACIKDFAIYRDSKDLKLPNWQRKMYSVLSLGYRNLKGQDKDVSTSMNLMAVIIIPLAIVVHSVLSWIFGMTLRPGWHSTIFGPYFVLAAIYSGTGVLIVAMWIFRRIYKLHDYIQDKHFVNLGYILLVLASAYSYFTFSEYLTDWYGGEEWNARLVEKMFSLHEYGWWFLFANVAGTIIPIIVVAIPALRKPGFITLASAGMVMAMWVKRYLIVVPTLETPLLPIQDTRMEVVKYAPTWVEWALTFGGIATFLFLFTMAAKYMTIISVSEYGEEEESR